MSTSTISETFYLVLARKRQFGLSARLTARAPKLAAGEVVMQLDVAVPRALFERPSLRAKVGIPEGVALQDMITADVAANVGELLQKQLGMRVELSAIEPDLEGDEE